LTVFLICSISNIDIHELSSLYSEYYNLKHHYQTQPAQSVLMFLSGYLIKVPDKKQSPPLPQSFSSTQGSGHKGGEIVG